VGFGFLCVVYCCIDWSSIEIQAEEN
jgi:hypothetical protein